MSTLQRMTTAALQQPLEEKKEKRMNELMVSYLLLLFCLFTILS
jgi:nitrate reductase NapE component